MWFYADNDGFPVFRDVAVEAVLPAPTPDDYEEVAAVTGRVFVAATPEQFTYDANGNVSEYVTTNGEIVAHYDYSPFGETLMQTGPMAGDFTHRFSTKPWCPVTGLYEYQMRKYKPEIGRWLSRDPIEENGSLNIFVFAKNSVSLYDIVGLKNDVLRHRDMPAETLTEMLLAGLLRVDEIHIVKNSKVYEEMMKEVKSVFTMKLLKFSKAILVAREKSTWTAR